jgi:hypothetical protein
VTPQDIDIMCDVLADSRQALAAQLKVAGAAVAIGEQHVRTHRFTITIPVGE